MSDEASRELPTVPSFPAEAKVCGNCKLWQPHSIDARGWVGPCRLQPSRGLFPPSAPICDYFSRRGTAAPSPPESEVRARAVRSVAPLVVKKRKDTAEIVADLGGELSMTREELMDVFREASGDVEVALAPKWEGGVIQLLPGKAELQGKELPINALFHKVVMIRDRLRTLEQKVNAHPKLSDAEKVEMQQYITRIYGSLTSFNVLFRDKSDQFVGAKEE
ncbi:MAG TPA: hypothetical protein VKE49_13645 [Myxococcaceae bacterium]|nr:hypothetical protein [Myxococcaceae bacterium]